MKRMRTSAALAAGVVASAVLVGAPVAAQEEDPGFGLSIKPAQGPAGVLVEVLGTGCFGSDVSIHFFDWAASDEDLASAEAIPNEDGTWYGYMILPEGLDPSADYGVGAGCWTDDVPEWSDPVDFDVMEPATRPTVPTTTPPTTAPVVTPSTTAPAAAPAKPTTTTVPAPEPAAPIVKEPGTLG